MKSVPPTMSVALPLKLPLASVFHTVYWPEPASFHATSQLLVVFSAPIGAHVPNWPTVTSLPQDLSVGPLPNASCNWKWLRLKSPPPARGTHCRPGPASLAYGTVLISGNIVGIRR